MTEGDDSRERLTSKLAELATRYLQRTAGEVIDLRATVEKYLAGERDVLQQIERAAHRIRGSGGMFGFAAVSDAASEIEVAIANETSVEPLSAERLAQLVERLDAQVCAALQADKAP